MDDEKNDEENEATDQATDQEQPNKRRRVHILDDAEKDTTADAAAKLRVVGVGGHICYVRVEATATLQELKACIEASVHIPAESQRLVYGVNCAETVGSGLGMYEHVHE